jgi:putative ABC transport system substrate-binding protein
MSKQGITMRFHTVGLIAILVFALLVAPIAAAVQQPGSVRRIGVLQYGSPTSEVERQLKPFLQFLRGLHELGWVEGQTLAMEYRWAHGQFEQLPDLAAELVQLQVDVIVAFPAASALAAKHVTSTVPIVFLVGTDPVASGLVASLAQPGGNLTGVASFSRALTGKRLEILKEAVPGATRVAVLFHPGDPTNSTVERETQAREARSLGIILRLVEVRDPSEFEEAFSVMSRERLDAFLLRSSALFYAHRTRVVDLAAQHRLPAMYIDREWVEAGGLMSYATSFSHLWQRAAVLVDKILKGAKPSDLPVEQAMKFELVINLKTAKELGLTIPPTLLFQADEVIQ